MIAPASLHFLGAKVLLGLCTVFESDSSKFCMLHRDKIMLKNVATEHVVLRRKNYVTRRCIGIQLLF